MKIAVVGATGKMGEEIRQLIEKNKKFKFVGGLASKDLPGQKIYKDPKILGADFDVIIDFSLAHVFSETLAWAIKVKKPFLSGTTGISVSQKKELAAAAKKIPVLWAPNTAPGIHLVKKILAELNVPETFDIQVTEYHHKMKKDRPSGTAILLQDTLKKKRNSIPEPISIRGGGIFGIHRIELMSKGEIITIEHHALGRTLFAQGALDAAAWLTSQKAGLHTMDEFLKDYK